MDTYKMFFAGSGGQGILLMGQMVGNAAMLEQKEATFFPSYGPEMRGGTANCTVIVSEKPISSPLIHESDCVVAMTLPSMLKFEPTLKPGGLLMLNSTLIHREPQRTDISVMKIPVTELANTMGNARIANIIMLGAFIRATHAVSSESIEQILNGFFGGKSAALLELNLKAYHHWQ
ncbi:MAG: 2-oxoacid:acceptor oxidoreductase family protein [Oscillospiraceae bacterium]|nr:2-oxoacid:acceptor oxidoreductase family protein [Oscillospiraceae bacterium]